MLFPCLLVLGSLQGPAQHDSYPEISPDRLRKDLQHIASDAFEGRATGTEAEKRAARFIAERFGELGLLPLSKSEYIHSFPAGPRRLEAEQTFLKTSQREPTEKENWQEFTLGEDFFPHPGAPEGEVRGEVVFVGYGLFAPAYEYDDFGLTDLDGKVALLFRWEPQADQRTSKFEGRKLTEPAHLAQKIRECRKRGAKAVLVCDPPGSNESKAAAGGPYWPEYSALYNRMAMMVQARWTPEFAERSNSTAEKSAAQSFARLQTSGPLGTDIPVLFVSTRVAQTVFRSVSADAREWVAEVDRSERGQSFLTNLRVHLKVQMQESTLTGHNVIGLLPGSDPDLKDEYIVIGAHYDHVGRNERGVIWNGADDNGSGTAGLLALAASFANSATETPKRSIVFIAFSGEEFGLLGSAWFLIDARIPHPQMVAMVNLDMIGRSLNKIVNVIGTKSSPMLRPMVERSNRNLGLNLDFDNEESFDRSDQASFYYQRIPILFFNTDEHRDYHRPSDTADKIDYETTSQILVLARRVIFSLANLPKRPPFEDGYRRLLPHFNRSPKLSLALDISFEQRLDF